MLIDIFGLGIIKMAQNIVTTHRKSNAHTKKEHVGFHIYGLTLQLSVSVNLLCGAHFFHQHFAPNLLISDVFHTSGGNIYI